MKYLIGPVIWISGIAFVEFVVPDIENAYQMLIGYFVGIIATYVMLK